MDKIIRGEKGEDIPPTFELQTFCVQVSIILFVLLLKILKSVEIQCNTPYLTHVFLWTLVHSSERILCCIRKQKYVINNCSHLSFGWLWKLCFFISTWEEKLFFFFFSHKENLWVKDDWADDATQVPLCWFLGLYWYVHGWFIHKATWNNVSRTTNQHLRI